MSWSWRERAEENDTEWINQLKDTEARPKFDELAAAASGVIDKSMGRLVVTTYDPYTGEIYTSDVRVNDIEDSRIIGGDGQHRMFVLPDLTAGYFDTQGGTDRMPDLIIDYDTSSNGATIES